MRLVPLRHINLCIMHCWHGLAGVMGRATVDALKSLGYRVMYWTRTQRSDDNSYGRYRLHAGCYAGSPEIRVHAVIGTSAY